MLKNSVPKKVYKIFFCFSLVLSLVLCFLVSGFRVEAAEHSRTWSATGSSGASVKVTSVIPSDLQGEYNYLGSVFRNSVGTPTVYGYNHPYSFGLVGDSVGVATGKEFTSYDISFSYDFPVTVFCGSSAFNGNSYANGEFIFRFNPLISVSNYSGTGGFIFTTEPKPYFIDYSCWFESVTSDYFSVVNAQSTDSYSDSSTSVNASFDNYFRFALYNAPDSFNAGIIHLSFHIRLLSVIGYSGTSITASYGSFPDVSLSLISSSTYLSPQSNYRVTSSPDTNYGLIQTLISSIDSSSDIESLKTYALQTKNLLNSIQGIQSLDHSTLNDISDSLDDISESFNTALSRIGYSSGSLSSDMDSVIQDLDGILEILQDLSLDLDGITNTVNNIEDILKDIRKYQITVDPSAPSGYVPYDDVFPLEFDPQTQKYYFDPGEAVDVALNEISFTPEFSSHLSNSISTTESLFEDVFDSLGSDFYAYVIFLLTGGLFVLIIGKLRK